MRIEVDGDFPIRHRRHSSAMKRPADRDEEEAFPRGGADVLNALEKRQIAQDAAYDYQQEQLAGEGSKSRGKRAKYGSKVCCNKSADSFVTSAADYGGASNVHGRAFRPQHPRMESHAG